MRSTASRDPSPPSSAIILSLLLAARPAGADLNFTINEFPLPPADSAPPRITAGPDGNLWFTERGANQIGRITPDGEVTEFAVPTAYGGWGITAGPDGNLWFTEDPWTVHQIGQITPAGDVTDFPVPGDRGPYGITTGPDGNLWFTADSHVGWIAPVGGTVAEFAVPRAANGHDDIVVGPDGNLWFAGGDGQTVGRITPDGTDITIFDVGLRGCDCSPPALTAGPDGNLWFAGRVSNASQLGRVTPDGNITRFDTPTPSDLEGITTGPDGALWFTETSANQIGQLVLLP